MTTESAPCWPPQHAPGSRGAAVDTGAPQVLDAATKKRMYNLIRNRQFRQLEAAERGKLVAQINRLTWKLASVRPVTNGAMESLWKDTVASLATQRLRAEADVRELQTKVAKLRDVTRILTQWVQRSTTRLHQGCLMAHDTCRQFAVDWVVLRLRHHVGIILDRCNGWTMANVAALNLAAPTVTIGSHDDGASYRVELWHDRVEVGSLDDVAAAVHATHLDPQQTHEQETLDSPRQHISYIRRPSAYGRAVNLPQFHELVLVCQLSHTLHQRAFCSHSITYDGSRAKELMARDWTKWTIVEQIDDGHCRVVDVLMATGLRRDGRYLPLPAEVAGVMSLLTSPTALAEAVAWSDCESIVRATVLAIHNQEVATMRALVTTAHGGDVDAPDDHPMWC